MKNPIPLSIPDGWREVEEKQFAWVLDQIEWTRESYRNGVQYRAGGDAVAIEMDDGRHYLSPMFTQQQPESIAKIAELVGTDTDVKRAAGIWLRLQAALKKQAETGTLSWPDVKEIISAAIKRTRKEIQDLTIRNQVNGRLIVMRKRVDEFIENPEAATNKCEKCGNAGLFCTCPKEIY